MRILFTLLLSVFILSGCTEKSPACSIAKTVSTHVTDEVAKQLSCSNKAAIQDAIDLQLAKLRVCDQVVTKSIIGELVCAPLVDGLLTGALAKVPADWNCTGGPLKDTLRGQLIDACRNSL